MFIVLVVIHFSEIRALRAFKVSGQARVESRKRMTVGTRYAGFPVTLIKSYSWRQRTD